MPSDPPPDAATLARPLDDDLADALSRLERPERQAVERAIAARDAELATLREYEARTRDTVCWGVACVHEAEALTMLVNGQERVDALRERAEAAEAVAARAAAYRAAERQVEQDVRDARAADRRSGSRANQLPVVQASIRAPANEARTALDAALAAHDALVARPVGGGT